MWVILAFIFSNLFTCILFSVISFLKGYLQGGENEKKLQKEKAERESKLEGFAECEAKLIHKMANCLNCGNGKSTGMCKLPFGECINMSHWEMKK